MIVRSGGSDRIGLRGDRNFVSREIWVTASCVTNQNKKKHDVVLISSPQRYSKAGHQPPRGLAFLTLLLFPNAGDTPLRAVFRQLCAACFVCIAAIASRDAPLAPVTARLKRSPR